MATIDDGFVDSGSSPPAASRVGTPQDNSARSTLAAPRKISLNKVGIQRLPENTGCKRKNKFLSRLEAVIHAGLLNKYNKTGRKAETYQCPSCHGYHVTSGGIAMREAVAV